MPTLSINEWNEEYSSLEPVESYVESVFTHAT